MTWSVRRGRGRRPVAQRSALTLKMGDFNERKGGKSNESREEMLRWVTPEMEGRDVGNWVDEPDGHVCQWRGCVGFVDIKRTRKLDT